MSDTISSHGYHETVIECRLNSFPGNLHRLSSMHFSHDARSMSHFSNDLSRAEYKRPVSLSYLFSSGVSCSLARRSDSSPDSSQGLDLHSSVPDAVTPFLSTTHEEGLFLFTLAQGESVCQCNSRETTKVLSGD